MQIVRKVNELIRFQTTEFIMKYLKKIGKILILMSLCSLLFARNNEEFRATWVITWEHDCDSTKIKKILDRHVEANMNAVLFQVRQGGTAYYNSSFEPWGYYANYQDPGFDPLAFAVKEAHKRGLELHAWFNTFQASSTIDGAPAKENPEWVCRDGDNNPMPQHRALSPGLQEVRDYTIDVAMEIVNNYDIDGLHLDYVRWNEYTTSSVLAKAIDDNKMIDGMITQSELKKLKTTTESNRYLFDVNHKYSDGVPEGFSSWEEWWRWSVTELVKTLHDSIQSEKPWVRLSAAALGNYRWGGWQGYGTVYQDAGKWYNQAYIDHLTPMHYHWTTANGFYNMLKGPGTSNWGEWLADTSDVLFSVGPGSYILADNNVWNRHSSIVDRCRDVKWVDGFQFFSYGTWDSYEYWEEAGATFFANKTKINNVFEKQPPPPPEVSLDKIDSLSYGIFVEPDESISADQWFAIYRSEDNIIDPDQDEIINIAFSDSAFYYIDEFSGNQNYNGQYHYGATCFNRFWNESENSNVVTSDSIPSFPPVVIATDPAEGDSISTNSNISFTFSKEIDPETFLDGFSIQPEIAVEKISISDKWYNAGKVVTIKFAEPLDFGTSYQLTLDENLLDKNGVALDGNGDGIPGDQFTLNFNTYFKDLAGPHVIAYNPAENTIDLDCEAPFNIIFNELLDPESVTENSVSLLSNGRSLTVTPAVTDYNGQSIVTVKPFSQLVPDGDVVLSLNSAIKDTAGNSMETATEATYHTADYYYSAGDMLDNFNNTGDWWDPEGSGSTSGIVGSKTNFGISRNVYLPAVSNSKSGRIRYEWDQEATSHFLRLHDPTGDQFDTTWTLQCYVYGDGSGNKFRFSCYEFGGNDDVAEVSKWTTVDWNGWKLIEWDLSDSNSVGFWSEGISNGKMDGNNYRLESFQMTSTDSSAISGEIYVDNLRLVKKSTGEPPQNQAPVVEALSDTSIAEGDYLKIYVYYFDPNENDRHQIIPEADTTGILFDVKGHTPGSRIYVVPEEGFSGESEISIIVRDYGIGELADTVKFKLSVIETGIDEEQIVNKFALAQNYPNPFNPVTNIDFSLPEQTQVRIVVFDILGRKVAEPVNGTYQPGTHKIRFNASELSSGVYLYKMITERKVITRKMMLLK
jgi:uncharacterized lipoprotein YddW (UPF0748 family)